MAEINSYEPRTLVSGTSGDDSIKNSGNYATIDAGTGDDSIYNSGWYVKIDTGDGNDDIYSRGDMVTINTGAGNDSVYNDNHSDVTIDTGDGNDTITNHWGWYNSVNAGAGDDIIYNEGSRCVTIDAGAGNDTIYNNWDLYDDGANVVFKYKAGDGNDLIEGFRADSTLQIGDGTGAYSSQVSGSDVIVMVGEGRITLVGAASLGKLNIAGVYKNPFDIVGTAVNDSIANSLDGATIQALVGNDSIENWSSSVTIDGGAGDDYIFSSSGGKNASISGGNGNDTISSWGDGSTIDGGAGNDSIVNGWGSNVTINGGTGNDVIYNNCVRESDGSITYYTGGSNVLFKYATGDGNDNIYGFNETSTLQIGGGTASYSKETIGNDIIVTVGDGKITLSGAASLSTVNIAGVYVNPFDIVGTAENDSIANSLDGATIQALGGNDYIRNYGANVIIDGGAGNDTLTGGDGEDLFVYSEGNDIITDYAAGDKISLGAAITNTSLSGSDATFTIGSNTLKVKNGKGKEIAFINADGKERTIIGGAYLADDNTKLAATLASWRGVADATARTSAIKITGNALANTIFGGSGKDSLYGKDGDDYLVGGAGADKLYGQNGNDTLWGGTGNDTLTGGSGDDLFIYSAGNDVIADYAAGDKVSLGASLKGASLSGSDVKLTVGSNTLTIKNAKDKTLSLMTSTGKELSTIISDKVTYTESSKAAITLPASIVSADATARTSAIKLTGNALANTILGGSGKDTLYGKNGDDYLVGNAGADKLYGQNGNDTLWGGIGNDTLTGGSGDDLFIYSAGNDVIADYATGDQISLGAAISKTSLSGSDVKLTVGSNTLTIKNAKDKTLSLMTSTGKELSTIISDKVTYTESSKAAVTLPASIVSADATARTSAIKITGNALANTIFGGSGKDTLYGKNGNDYLSGGSGVDKLYGGNGNDTLIGGSGNDSLWGESGADTFVYNSGDGKDVISGFANDDLLQITGTFSASVNSAGSVVFKVGSTASAITLKNFTAETFNINGNSYQISGTKLVKK